jgi:hypothetical protein
MKDSEACAALYMVRHKMHEILHTFPRFMHQGTKLFLKVLILPRSAERILSLGLPP